MNINDEKEALANIKAKLPSMARFSFDTNETKSIYELAGADLLSTSQMRVLVMLMAQKLSQKGSNA